MTRQDLIDVLSLDGTEEQIKAAIEAKELADQEREKIYAYLEEKDQNRANEMLMEFLEGVRSKPSYDSAKESKAGWAELREAVIEDIRALNNAERKCREQIEQLEQENKMIQTLLASNSNSKDSALYEQLQEVTQKKLESEYTELDKITKQHSALALMHTAAQSMEAQMRSQIFLEETQPYRDSLKHAWSELSNRVHGAIMHTQNMRAAKAQANDLDFHPIKDAINKIRLSQAKSYVKEVNRVKAQVEKAEKKLIDQANKISKKEFRKDQFLNKLNHWSRGVQPPVTELEQIHDVEKAKEVLSASQMFSDKKLEAIQKNLTKLQNLQEKAEGRAQGALERVAADLKQRREEVRTLAQDIAKQLQNGELGFNMKSLDKIDRHLQTGMDSTFIKEDSLEKDLKEYMMTHGFESIIEGYQIPETEIPDMTDLAEEITTPDPVEEKEVPTMDDSGPAWPTFDDGPDEQEIEEQGFER